MVGIQQRYNLMSDFKIQVFGWQEGFKKSISEILTFNKNNEIELRKISFSSNGFLTLEEKELKTVLLGFNPKLIGTQLRVIIHLIKQLKLNKKVHLKGNKRGIDSGGI